MGTIEECRALPDGELAKTLLFLAHHEKRAVARLLAHLNEFDRRRLELKTGGRSLFEYCVRVLGYDEADAYRRVRGARVAGQFPDALELLESGKLSLTSLVVLQPILTRENAPEWLQQAQGKTRRQLEALVAARFPEQARLDVLRRLPQPVVVAAAPPGPVAQWSALPAPAAPIGRLWQAVSPISAERVRVGFDAAGALLRLIERAKQLLRHKFPEGRLEDVLKEALETFLDRRDPQRKLLLRSPRNPPEPSVEGEGEGEGGALHARFLRAYAAGRYIPAKVKSAVWARDQGRCAWRFEDATVCGGRDFVEFDHIVPYAKGGRSEYRNLRLLCRAHNQLAAQGAFPAWGTPRDG